jgi:energy-coupling factor transporter ATP-binding protein EcfA2
MLIRPTTLEEMYIPPTGRGVLVGMTGSGKTTLARLLLEPFPYVACIDPKGMLDWPGYERHTRLKDLVKSTAKRLNYAPDPEELRDLETIDAFFRFIYLRRNTFLYVDEVYAVAYRNEIPPHYHSILTRGRERGNGLLSATQRPMQIPTVIMSEAESWYVFRLSMEGDRRKVEQSIGLDSEKIRKLPKRQFIYSRVDEDIQTPPLTLNLKSPIAA